MGSPTLAACLALAMARPVASDWPQYRGPERDGVAAPQALLGSWPDDGPRVLWRRPIGSGYSGVSIVGDRLYTMDADGERERVVCLDRSTGETVWQADVGPFVEAELGDGGPRSTPTVAGGVVYAVSSQSRLVALAAADGTPRWQADLTELGPVPRFGYSVSPLVDGEVVVLDVGKRGEGPGFAAFDRSSGEVRWTALTGPAGYSSPVVAEIGGRRQYLLFRAAERALVGLATDGRELWRYQTPDALSAIVMPIFLPPDRVFVSTSEDGFGGRMVEVKSSEGAFETEEIWAERLMRNHFNSSVVVGDHLYGFDNGTLRCLDAATGRARWARRGFGKGSLIAVGDRLIVLSDAGLVALVEASPVGYVEHGRRQAMSGRSWTAPSLAGGRLYLRDFDEVVSLEVGAGPEKEAP
jgi:outer membrane protein assembly factor BamB